MNSNFKSHALDTIEALREHAQPSLSAPYLYAEDAMDVAPARSIVYINSEGMYQFQRMATTCREQRHLRELAHGMEDAAGLTLFAYNLDGEWVLWEG